MRTKRSINNSAGVTLIELLLAIILSSIVIMSVFYFFNSMNKTATVQSQTSDMHENAEYALRRLSEELSAAGAGMNSLVNALTINNSTNVTLVYNPRGGTQTIKTAVTSATIPVDNGTLFMGARFIVHQPSGSQTVSLKKITAIDTVANPDSITVEAAFTMANGDIINALDSARYYLHNTNLCLNSDTNVVAENIDNLIIQLQQLNGTVAANWQAARVISITVRAKTAIADPAFTGTAPDPADHFRRITMSIRIPLKNKV